MLPTRSVGELNPNAALGHSVPAEGRSFLSAVRSELAPNLRCGAPIPTKSLDEQDAGREAARMDIHRRHVRGQCGVLRRHDFQVGNKTALIASVGLIECPLSGGDGGSLADALAL